MSEQKGPSRPTARTDPVRRTGGKAGAKAGNHPGEETRTHKRSSTFPLHLALASRAGRLAAAVADRVPASRRSLARFARTMRRCEDCRHWDYEAGQRAMFRHSAFAAYASVVSPDTAATVASSGRRPFCGEDTRKRSRQILGEGPHSWADYGGCLLRSEAVHRRFRCGSWKA